jgi:hypothetical protein
MALVELSPYIDVALMTTIAQSAATFIAITAGFFTTKIISLSTERSRLIRRLAETESQLRTLKQKESRYNGKRESILNEKATERVNELSREIVTNPQQYPLSSTQDLLKYFETYYQFKPTERHIKMLIDRTNEIREKWQESNKKEELRKKRNAALKTWERQVDISALVHTKSDGARFSDTVWNTHEHSTYTNIDNELNETRYKISNLEDEERRVKEELQDVVYPQYARFGFASFIFFAIVGVIIPISYRIWTTFFLDQSNSYPVIRQYLPISNSVVIALFTIGLAVNFVYIFSEVRPSLKKRPR